MAKLQVLIAMTLNGFVPARNDSLLQWIQNSDDGFPYWRGRSTRMLYPGYPLVDLICDKEQLVRTKTFRNGICRLTYRKTLQ